MLEVFTKIEKVKKKWAKIKLPNFLHVNILQTYYHEHPNIKHLFFMDNNMRLYAHIFNLRFNKTKNYLQNNSTRNMLLNFINFNVLYLTNSFITNMPAFTSDKAINLKQLLSNIKYNYSLIVIPDFLFKKMIVEDDQYTKIEVEEEMILNIKDEWNKLEDYMYDLRKKYRNKVRRIIKKSNDLKIRKLNIDDLKSYAKEINELFNQVAEASRFKGPKFNTNSYISFVKQDLMSVEGYFLNKRLVGFSSRIQEENKLYSYFVGFDRELNRSLPIYGRILIENIKSAIISKKKQLILGRTANEYKSNFGAFPIKS